MNAFMEASLAHGGRSATGNITAEACIAERIPMAYAFLQPRNWSFNMSAHARRGIRGCSAGHARSTLQRGSRPPRDHVGERRVGDLRKPGTYRARIKPHIGRVHRQGRPGLPGEIRFQRPHQE
jgi:hypothetical protein